MFRNKVRWTERKKIVILEQRIDLCNVTDTKQSQDNEVSNIITR
jgi:hypothetical protein